MEILWRTTPTQIGILVHRRNTLVSLGANSLLILRARKVILSGASSLAWPLTSLASVLSVCDHLYPLASNRPVQ